MVISEGYAAAVRRLWKGRCSVAVRAPVKDGARTRPGETTILRDVPCRISFSSDDPVSASDNAHRTAQRVKLFLSKDVVIPPGSKITVTQNGVTGVYQASGVPPVYTVHQEISLELFGGWT